MGGATPEGTNRYLSGQMERGVHPRAYRTLGRTGWLASAIGFGGYRVSLGVAAHEASLLKALREGCNLVDTSSNYADGGSERLVGKVLKQLFDSGELHRDEVVIVSKVGYVQGENLRIAESREKSRAPYPDMVKYAEGCWHCIHPEFIHDQLARSLERLGLEKIDAYLLHNPEYYLLDQLNRHPEIPLDEIRDVYYDRITRAFRKLEDEVAAGKIGCYGVSSNTFGNGVHEKDATSASALWEIACHVAKDRTGNPYLHHFSVVQLPLNVLESGPALEANCEDDRTALDFCAEKEIAVLANRPLNAIQGNQLIRLANLKTKKTSKTPAQAVQAAVKLEEEFRAELAPRLEGDKGAPPPEEWFRWAEQLATADLRQGGLEQWKQIEFQIIRPQITGLAQALDHQLGGEVKVKWMAWRDRYLPAMVEALEAIRADFSKRSQKQIQQLAKTIDPFLPESWREESLSRKALAVVAHTPGVTVVLNGMREPDYVDDSLGVLRKDPFPVTTEVYQAFKAPAPAPRRRKKAAAG